MIYENDQQAIRVMPFPRPTVLNVRTRLRGRSGSGTFRTSSDVRSMIAIRAKADIERLDPEMVAAQAHVEVRAEPIAFFQRSSSTFIDELDSAGCPTLAVLEAPWPPVESYTENPTCWPSRFPSCFSPKIFALEVYLVDADAAGEDLSRRRPETLEAQGEPFAVREVLGAIWQVYGAAVESL